MSRSIVVETVGAQVKQTGTSEFEVGTWTRALYLLDASPDASANPSEVQYPRQSWRPAP